MSAIIKLLVVLAIVGVAGTLSYRPAVDYWESRNTIEWETAKVLRGDVTRYINSTGTVQPVLSVSVGSFVSGPIVELNVDFNDEVKKGELLAKIDPRLFNANVERDEAILASRQAEVERIEAQLEQAIKSRQRGERLREGNREFLSESEMDVLIYEVKSLEAQHKLAVASVDQAKASLENSRANLEYTDIRAPVDGVVIDRKIDPGQTLAAQFQTPELFVVAPDLREKVHIFASVDEADMGMIRKAQEERRPVTFSVDAYPDELFEGEIEQVRMSSVTTQNVVTYPVVVATSNPDRKLLPGMTTNISFEVDAKSDVLKIPNAALRFYPEDIETVHPDDRDLIDGSRWDRSNDEEEAQSLSAKDRTQARRDRNKRHVWIVDGAFIRAIEIRTGISQNRYTEFVSGNIAEGMQLVTGRDE